MFSIPKTILNGLKFALCCAIHLGRADGQWSIQAALSSQMFTSYLGEFIAAYHVLLLLWDLMFFLENTMFVAEYHGFKVCFTIFVNPCRESMSLRQSFPCQKIPCRIALFQKAEGKICRFHPRICHKPSPVITIHSESWVDYISLWHCFNHVSMVSSSLFQHEALIQILPCRHKYKGFLQIYRNKFGCDWK